ncbi:MAG: carbohydrate ABC transporter permease [Proteobacteria bacterium]|nr:carbohydrate ABC transporter permease [Pseudomonadota bacterium]
MSVATLQRPATSLRRTKLLTTALLAVFLIYTLVPLVYLLIAATKDDEGLFNSFGLWFAPQFHLFGNIRALFTFQGGIFTRWLINTAFYSVTSAVGATLLASAAGYAFAKFRFLGRDFLFALTLGAVMIPQTALAIPLFLLMSKVGLVNTPWAVILPSLVNPLGVYLMRVYAEQSVPDELIDAARIDGAGEGRIFATIALRILSPAVITVLLLSFVATWNNYFLPLVMLESSHLFPLTIGLADWYEVSSAGGGGQALFPLVLTGSLVSILPICALFLAMQRFWQSGLATGSVK